MQESFKYSETKFHNYTANLQSERMRVDPKIAEASRALLSLRWLELDELR